MASLGFIELHRDTGIHLKTNMGTSSNQKVPSLSISVTLRNFLGYFRFALMHTVKIWLLPKATQQVMFCFLDPHTSKLTLEI